MRDREPGIRPRTVRIDRRRRVTVPAAVLRVAGLDVGDWVAVRTDARGRLVIERDEDVIEKFAGALTGVYEPGYLDRLRDEWR
jgi:bifunctional DNA-binding transcriptional regulator/antitoxin component of YhaV-PrlF toxin-antitoxin module